LTWLSLTSLLILLTCVYGLVALAVENRWQDYGISETGVLVLLALIVWTVALNGLRQRPGFEDTQLATGAMNDEPDNKPYERSALSTDHLQRISFKLSGALSEDQVHLEPDLNLLRLAKHVGEPSQYVSQTLSQQLDTNFFDFINRARIEAAKALLMNTDDSVLDIAYATGFNSRSSFYKAFRQYTNQTPSQYRKS
jgi:AraC-like DNA-binding protein